jgi:hypothetical protein
MNLRSFTKQALEEVVGGVRDAQVAIGAMGAVVSPGRLINSQGELSRPADYERLTTVEFDVAITATEEVATKGGVSALKILEVGADNRSTDTQTSRIRFSVRVRLPLQDEPYDTPEAIQLRERNSA